MIHRIKNIRPLPDYMLHVIFDDGKDILYDVKDDIQALEGYKDLENITGLFQQAQLDHSRTCVFGIIRRVDYDQYFKDKCDYCGQRYGYDYLVYEKN